MEIFVPEVCNGSISHRLDLLQPAASTQPLTALQRHADMRMMQRVFSLAGAAYRRGPESQCLAATGRLKTLCTMSRAGLCPVAVDPPDVARRIVACRWT